MSAELDIDLLKQVTDIFIQMVENVDEIGGHAADARRWRALKQRHGMALVRLATGSTSYSTTSAPALLDAWADMAAAELEAFDPEKYASTEVPERIAELNSAINDGA